MLDDVKVSLEQYQIMFSVGLELNVEILHRGRRKTKENTKVVATVWGAELFIQFLAALAILPRTISKNRMNSYGRSCRVADYRVCLML